MTQAPADDTKPAAGSDALDNASSARNAETSPFPIVGIGASAGGLAAFEAFFSGMPEDAAPGMAFVLVQHLAPDHKSLLSEIVQRYTKMKVFEVEDGMTVQVNCAYIIPPNHDMALLGGALQLLEPSAPRGQRLPVDFFFRSLAAEQHDRAIAIVLSGTGSDGTQGVRAVKAEGGMVMAQLLGSTEYDGMPRSALGTGVVDYELRPEEMAGQVIAYAFHRTGPSGRLVDGLDSDEGALQKVFVLLRAQTGHDFSQYKPRTIRRRIARRMAVQQVATLAAYVKYLRENPSEAAALFRDLLIGVTSFFRDPAAFEVLETQVLPRLFAAKPEGGTLRVWTAGCSTGEEAYSLAILLLERMLAGSKRCRVQIFATDIDAKAIAKARAGSYPSSIAADMTKERLSRFFVLDADGASYTVDKSIRDLVVFSEQDLIRDPPFSKLDLVVCRNVLIYLGAPLQKRLIPLFRYALNPGGVLFLGTSEAIGEFGDLFSPIDRTSKLYLRTELPVGDRRSFVQTVPPLGAPAPQRGDAAERSSGASQPSPRQLVEEALLRWVAPASALVNERGDILYLHGRAGKYLEPPPGEVGVPNILAMAREGLDRDLSAALLKAKATNEVALCPRLRVKTNGDSTFVRVAVHPVARGGATPLFLVTLEDLPASSEGAPAPKESAAVAPPESGANVDADARIAALKASLRAAEEYLESTNEELQTSNEEFKSSNEELQSMNEELQSTNEELETSKEELQSINEELTTVNAEMQTKVQDLVRANSDMSNLLAGTGIGTLFVDQQLHVLRFTPSAARVINLIPSDVGRPLAHMVSNLIGYNLVAEVKAVLESLVPRQTEVETTDGSWYAVRILPYRTVENAVEGAVITLVDVSESVRGRETLRRVNDVLRLAVVVRDSNDAITVQDLEGRILAWNRRASKLYGWTEAEALALHARDRVPPALREKAQETLHGLATSPELRAEHTLRLTKAGTVIRVAVTSTALVNELGQMYAIATTERELAAAEGSLQEGAK